MLNIAICDDEPAAVRELALRTRDFFSGTETEAGISEFYDGRSLLESCKGSYYDVIFLDIKMEAPDGMETARRLRDQHFEGYIIFVTILEDQVFDAFEVSAYDYLVKPVDDERFRHIMNRLQDHMRSSFIRIHKDNESHVLALNEIVYCEVMNKKIYIHTIDGGTIDYYGRIEELEKRLGDSPSRFFRCHRSFLINLEHLKGFGKGTAHMRGGVDVPVSRLRQGDLEAAVIKYLKDK